MLLSPDPAARRRLALLACAALAALVIGVAIGAGSGGEPEPERAATVPQPQRDAVERLSLRQRVGQLLVSSFDGPTVPDYLRRRLAAGETAGVILFGRNLASEAQLSGLTRSLQAAGGGSALVAADQEGGEIRTVPSAGPPVTQPAQGGPAQVEETAREAANGLRRAGINLNLAPVADVPSGPAALAGRSFPGSPEEVGARVRASVRGMQSGRVAATAKHFPGLGAAAANTDDAPVTIDASRGELESRDLVPFRAAIRERAQLVMASHALYPALDGREIASQSPAVMRGLLRERLGFRGVAVSDSLEAEAVLARSGVGEAGVRSLAAGVDLLLLTGSASYNEVFPRALERARRSPAFRAQVTRAAARVLELKRELGLAVRGG